MSAVNDDPEQVRQDIQQTREQLGDTVAALAAKSDVKGRLRAKADGVADGLRQQAEEAGPVAKSTMTWATREVSRKPSAWANALTRTVRRSADTTGSTVSSQRKAVLTSARSAATRIRASVRARPVPILTAAGAAAAALGLAAYRRRRAR
ncbi:DUF3618 domain-containing protein [Micromonospora lutea]|uniref:DUF3618 domain-containing protein n=1 Tax=Micromonospora lutea TaxID=419825 RepID=A0ABQ4IXN2_9ACTN|nr:DUF3618 domain-containing protein [Micromonospora lutea]GIJ22672.1 hypothetical protein Vlu01_32960 [Micromonospora lutea]